MYGLGDDIAAQSDEIRKLKQKLLKRNERITKLEKVAKQALLTAADLAVLQGNMELADRLRQMKDLI